MRSRWVRIAAASVGLLVGSAVVIGCGAPAVSATPAAPPTREHVPEQIVSRSQSGTARELFERGERAVQAARYEEGKDALETLLAAWRAGSNDARAELEPLALYNLGIAYEGLGRRPLARDVYLDLEKRFADSTPARITRTRLFSVLAYLEDWDGLFAAAERALARGDASEFDRMGMLAARALARIEKGEDGPAARDVQEGLDLMETLRVGSGGRLPTPAAMLRLAQAEVARVKSEKISFSRAGVERTDEQDLTEFMPKMEARCQGLMDAQRTYADAMRAQDPFFSAFGAFRVGEMYRALHRDLMKVPPTTKAKTQEQRDLFFAMMHVRYRVLLEKAHDMMARTLTMSPPAAPPPDAASSGDKPAPARDPDYAMFLERAAKAKADIEAALAEEKALLEKLPYNEATVQRALDLLREKHEKKLAGLERSDKGVAKKNTRP